MHEEGVVAEARERLRAAGLIPPVKALVWQDADHAQPSRKDHGSVRIDVTAPVSPELEARLRQVMNGLAFEVRSVASDHGVTYGGESGSRPTP